MLRHTIAMLGLTVLAACSTVTPVAKRVATVNPASLAASPGSYDGREVEVVGLIVWDGATQQLQQSHGTYCRASEKASVGAEWARWAAITPKDHLRQVTLRGTFRAGAAAAPQVPLTSGTLEPGFVLRWLSPPQEPCQNKIGQ